ncbi:exocyst complex component EXO70B1-like [Curcuma longa]|uniref:exocyst complex component EXO70B1-like n=1 Tax=Curcuma longa TaxID=136217 RepID=UPI003D9F9AF5
MEDDDGGGDERLFAAVRHFASSFRRIQSMTDNALQDFYDGSVLALSTSSSDPHRLPVTLERDLRSLERHIHGLVDSNRLIWSDSAAASSFLDSVDDLLSLAADLGRQPGSAAAKPLLDRADHLIRRCVLRLDEEFRSIVGPPQLRANGRESTYFDGGDDDENIPVAIPVEAYDIVIDALPPGSVADLKDIARRMVAAGFGRECVETYASFRRGFVEESIARLGLLPPPEGGYLTVPWEVMEDEIPRWAEAARMVFLILIPSEQRLCGRVFASVPPSYADLAFYVSCAPSATEIVSFAAAVACGDHGPERLFGQLNLYETVRSLLPELDPLLSDGYSAELLGEVVAVHKALGASIRRIFMELENRIRRDPARAAVPGGDVHPMTRYVMNYLTAACAKETLAEVMAEEAAQSVVPLPVRVAWIADILLENLDAKSKIFRDPALCFVFLMNNVRYMIAKAEGSDEVASLLGEEWFRRMRTRVQQWAGEYQRAAWGKVLAALRVDRFVESPAATERAMRDKLGMFNSYLEEIWRTQGNWVAVDEELRGELRAAIAAVVLPAYGNLVERIRQAGDGGRMVAGRYLKYSVEEVKAKIYELFQEGRRRP